MSKSKGPQNKYKPYLKKTPKTDPHNLPEKISGKRPVWRVGFLDFEGPWGWGNIGELSLFQVIREKLKNFETMTWSEIEGHEHHFMPVKNISKEAKQRLREIKQDDLDQLFSLRLSGRQRLWGKREGEILYILWWDPEHTVYPVSIKYT